MRSRKRCSSKSLVNRSSGRRTGIRSSSHQEPTRERWQVFLGRGHPRPPAATSGYFAYVPKTSVAYVFAVLWLTALQTATRWPMAWRNERLMAYGELDPSSGVPLYRQIKEILRREIAEGTADPNTPMTEAQLLGRFDVSRAPIRQALQELVSEGYVYRKQGKGTFPVTGARVRRPADVRSGALYQYLSDSGLHPAGKVSGVERVEPSPQIQDRLGLEAHERLLHFTRLISVEDEPLVEASVYIRAPEDFSPTAEELEDQGSAFELLEREFGMALDRAEHEAWATAATADQAATFGVSEGSPLLVIETIFFTTGDRPAGWRSAVHQAEKFKYRFTTSR